ncbi:collagen-like protein [Flavobacteriaceae bacterium R38]|nr:collagen-like protein [Flavobacteriaceae bacterium R38]
MQKRLLTLIFPVILSLFVLSCDGEDGIDGQDGALAQVFEVQIDFNQANNFSEIVTFPNSIEVFESDAILVFLLEGVDENGNDIFTPLPQNFFVNQGLLQYSFNNTLFDVSIFLDANFDLGTLSADFTDNQDFRIVVVPAEFAQNATVNLNNFSEVMSAFNLNPANATKMIQ